ncbi:hypothetical protein CJ030_MR8G006749 [Morella rubra]|uniref:Uncharacterized protein n=1 Tax=Morella rubra TaxID=262757 RepID=A0A6A1UNQ7_9ROSI|nr:hypothetical protein CJ030_MR8G006749 [Morella rubra]
MLSPKLLHGTDRGKHGLNVTLRVVNSLMSVVDANCVQQTPTFLFLKGGTRVDIVVGANPSQLQQTLGRHLVCRIHGTTPDRCPIRRSDRCPIHRGRRR